MLLVTITSKLILQKLRNADQIFYVCYTILFQKATKNINITVLIKYQKKINIINLVYVAKLDLELQNIDINIQKIDIFFLKAENLVIIIFQFSDKLNYLQFFWKIYFFSY